MKKARQNKIYIILAILIIVVLASYLIDFFAIKLLLLLLLATGVYVLYLIQNKRTEKAMKSYGEFYRLKINMIRSSLDPHFLFNALNTVSFSMHKNDIETATSNLSSISKFMRTSFGDFEKFGHELNEEVEFIKNYLALEKFRFNEQFNYTIKVMPYVNDMTKVPCFSIFCFVENALKKGVLSQEKSGNIAINIDESQTDRALIVRISDDGLYRNLTDSASFTHNINVVNSLVNKLNDLNRDQKIAIAYSANGNENGEPRGCIVEMKIPLEYNYNLTPTQSL